MEGKKSGVGRETKPLPRNFKEWTKENGPTLAKSPASVEMVPKRTADFTCNKNSFTDTVGE